MKQNLSKRLFTITLSLIIGLMLIAYFAQAFFFENFYTEKKTMSLVQEVNKFHDLYSPFVVLLFDWGRCLRLFVCPPDSVIIVAIITP